MLNWLVRGLVWAVVGIAAITFTLALTAGADSASSEVPAWVPFAGMGLLVVGGSVLRRGLLDDTDA